MDLRRFPRVLQLLGRSDALRRRQRTDDADEALLELGRYVQWLMRQEPAVWARIEAEGEREYRGAAHPTARRRRSPFESIDELPSEDVSMDVSLDLHSGTSASGDRALALEPDAGPAPVEPEADENSQVRAAVERRDLMDPGVPQGRRTSEEIAWLTALEHLLELLGTPPKAVGDARDAHKLLNATSQLELRWAGLPDNVQVALVGMIGARCRMILAQDPADVSARLVLGRLNRFHAARKLSGVKALSDGADLEYTSWPEEARRWWDVLVGQV